MNDSTCIRGIDTLSIFLYTISLLLEIYYGYANVHDYCYEYVKGRIGSLAKWSAFSFGTIWIAMCWTGFVTYA